MRYLGLIIGYIFYCYILMQYLMLIIGINLEFGLYVITVSFAYFRAFYSQHVHGYYWDTILAQMFLFLLPNCFLFSLLNVFEMWVPTHQLLPQQLNSYTHFLSLSYIDSSVHLLLCATRLNNFLLSYYQFMSIFINIFYSTYPKLLWISFLVRWNNKIHK